MHSRTSGAWSGIRNKATIIISLVLALSVWGACAGSPAAPEEQDDSGVPPSSAAEPTEPSGQEGDDEGEPEPVATPTEASDPPESESSDTGPVSGKVNLAQADLGNQLFTDHDVSGETGVYMRLVHDFFIHGRQGQELVPGIATDWSVSDDGLDWTFQVREGVPFHNGETVTVEDVAFSLEEALGERAGERAKSPAVGNMARAVEPFEVTGENEVSVRLTENLPFFGFFLSEMNADPVSVIFDKEYREEVGREGYNADPSPGGTGPFRLTNLNRGSSMEFERFEDYWKMDERNHRFQELEIHIIPELSTRMAALRNGELDIVPVNLEVKNQVEGMGAKMVFSPEANYIWMITEGCYRDDVELEVPCDKKEFRQALDYAVDKELIVNEVWGAEMAEAKGIAYVTPSSLGYEPDLDSWPYDPEKGRELLAEIDCENASCFPNPYTLYTWDAANIPFMPDVAQLICRMWEENLGVENCEVEVGDSVSIKDRLHSFSIAGNYVVRPNEARFDGGKVMFSGYAGEEPTKTDDPEVAQIVRDAVGTVGTQEERHEAYHEMYVKLREEHWEWSIGYINQPWATGPKIAEWQPWPLIPYASALWTVELNQ